MQLSEVDFKFNDLEFDTEVDTASWGLIWIGICKRGLELLFDIELNKNPITVKAFDQPARGRFEVERRGCEEVKHGRMRFITIDADLLDALKIPDKMEKFWVEIWQEDES